MAGRINKEWHLNNKMPEKATVKQKIEWHTAHAANCSCRDSKVHIEKLKKKLG